MDAQALLSQVEAAITALLTGGHTSYSIGARTVTRLDVEDLMIWRQKLLAEVQRATGGGIRIGRITRPGR